MSAGSTLVLGTWIRDRGRLTPERVAIDFDGRLLTYAELDRDSSRLAAELTERGLARGDRVAVLADNCPEYVTLFFACAKAGLVVTPLSWRLAAPEIAYQLDQSQAALLVVSRRRRAQAESSLAAAANRRSTGQLGAAARRAGDAGREDPPHARLPR